MQSKPHNNSEPSASLPREIPRPVSRLQIVIVMIAALVCVLGLNVIISISDVIDRIDGGTQVVEQKWKILRSLDQRVDWVILGDSSASNGVVAKQLGISLGGSAVNLGTLGNMLAVDDVWMLDEYINLYGAPENVIIIHVYDMWSREVETSSFAKVPLSLGFWWSRKPALPSDIGESVELTAFRYLPLYQSKALVRNPGRLLIAPNQIESDGFIPVEYAQPSAVKKDLKGHSGIYRAQSFVPSRVNQRAMDRLVDLTREHRINIFVANSPIFEGMKSDPDFQAYSWGFKNYW